MPQFDLSTLDNAELRRLLDSARRQGQAAQSYEILQEMEARRQRGPRPLSLSLSPKRRGKARMISLELGDPLDLKLDPELDETFDDLPPLRLVEDDPLPEPPPPEPAPHPAAAQPRGWAHWGALIFAVGLGAGVGAGWWAADGPGAGAPRSPSVAAAAPPPAPARRLAVQTASLAPAVPPANAEPPAVSSAVQSAPATSPATSAPPTDASPVPASTVVAEAAPSPAPAVEPAAHEAAPAAKPAEIASAEETACGSAPADRAICADPKLRRLQGELRGAYAEALKAHEDRALLRQRELAWAEARNEVTDPDQLKSLYRQRIEKLRAATADALRRRQATVSPRTAVPPG